MKIFPLLFLLVFSCANSQTETVKTTRNIQVYFKNPKTQVLDSAHLLDKDNKELKYKGYVKDNTIEFYDRDNNLWMQGEFKNDRLNGIAYFFRENGKIYETGTYKNGERDGLYITLDENMKPLAFTEYIDGRGTGMGIRFKNGIPSSITPARGDQDSIWQSLKFHENGKFKTVIGPFDFEYDDNGNPIKE